MVHNSKQQQQQQQNEYKIIATIVIIKFERKRWPTRAYTRNTISIAREKRASERKIDAHTDHHLIFIER